MTANRPVNTSISATARAADFLLAMPGPERGAFVSRILLEGFGRDPTAPAPEPAEGPRTTVHLRLASRAPGNASAYIERAVLAALTEADALFWSIGWTREGIEAILDTLRAIGPATPESIPAAADFALADGRLGRSETEALVTAKPAGLAMIHRLGQILTSDAATAAFIDRHRRLADIALAATGAASTTPPA